MIGESTDGEKVVKEQVGSVKVCSILERLRRSLDE